MIVKYLLAGLMLALATTGIAGCGNPPTATSAEQYATATPQQPTAAPAEQPATATPQQPTATPKARPATASSQQPTTTPAEQPATATPQQPTATPTARPTTATSQPPPATPAERPPTPTMQPPAVAAFPDELAALLAMVPANTSQFSFVNIETVMRRPPFQEVLEYSLEDFIGSNEKAPSEELLRSAGVSALVLGNNRDYEWSCILRGDFTMIQEALSQAAMESGASTQSTWFWDLFKKGANYAVGLAQEQREELHRLIRVGKNSARLTARARILLKSDDGAPSGRSSSTVYSSSALPKKGWRRFCRTVPRSPRKLDDRGEAHLIALACSPAPEGHELEPCVCWPGRWSSWGWRPPCLTRGCASVSKKRPQAVAEEGVVHSQGKRGICG